MCNTVVKYYHGLAEITTFNRPVFVCDENGNVIKRTPKDTESGAKAAKNAENEQQRRTRQRVREIAYATPFQCFATFTIDPKRYEATDIKVASAQFAHWLHNRAQRSGLTYLAVGEYHKRKRGEDVRRVHYHALITDTLERVDSGHKDRAGHKVYNLPQWRYGFSTAIELYGDKGRSLGYIAKYIGKETDRIFGHSYWAGGPALQRGPLRVEYLRTPYTPARSEYEVPESGGLRLYKEVISV